MKKVLSSLMAALLGMSLLASCGNKATQPTKGAGEGEKKTEAKQGKSDETKAPEQSGGIEKDAKLVYWPMWAETEPQGKVISEAIDAFTAKTGVKVDVNWGGGRDTRKTLQPALDAGETIDLFDEDIERVNITWGKYLLDLESMYDASALNGKQNKTLIDLAKKVGGGTLKSVPYQPSAFVMMYSKAAFEKAGVTAAPTTWEEFLAACQKIKDAGIIPFTTDDAYMAAVFGYFMDRVAGKDTTYAVAGGDFKNPAVLETAKVLEDLVKKGYIDKRAASNQYPVGQGNVADGSVAMCMNGTWLPNEVRQQAGPDFKWGSFALPKIKPEGDGVESNNFGAQCFAINKDTKYPKAAFAFIEWMTSGEWDQKLADETIGVPMSQDATWPAPLTEAKAIIDKTTNRLNWAVDMENNSNVNASIKENFAKLIDGSIDAQGFADNFAKIQK